MFPNTPAVLLFETAFFAELPRRESAYGIDQELSETLGLRRYGYYGLLHEAACEYAAREHRSRRPRSTGRALSICLEAHPEVAAVIGRRPLMCTSGATPLEGIPGHSSCGELDPSIALMLARKLKWGPEQINTVLTQQSGLMGLVGRPVMLDDVLAAEAGDLEPAKNLLQNRILMACGAGMAAMGGVDDIVFSGRFASAGLTLGPWLRDRLTFRGGNENSPPELALLHRIAGPSDGPQSGDIPSGVGERYYGHDGAMGGAGAIAYACYQEFFESRCREKRPLPRTSKVSP